MQNRWKMMVVGLALAVLGFVVGRNTGGKWKVVGTGPSAVLYNEHTGVALNRTEWPDAKRAQVVDQRLEEANRRAALAEEKARGWQAHALELENEKRLAQSFDPDAFLAETAPWDEPAGK